LLRGLGTASRAVWIADERLSPEELGVPVDVRMALPGHRVELPLNLDLWGSYTRAAEQLASAAGGAKASPLVWRLSVGALALGAELRAIANALNEPTAQALGGLCRVLVDRLARNSPLRRSVAKALLRRTPLPRRELVDLTDVPHDHAPLVTDCVGYGDPVRVSESLRARLIDAIASDRNETASGHLAYAEYFEKMDGALAPSNISKPRPMAAWVEKVHHLGRAGATGVARWAKLELPSPDFYWDRARYLSIDLSDFKGAAETYKHCLERFPDDDYAHHYLAYNLQKAKQDNEAVILHYTEAARRDAKNPWWNRRLVVALIRQGMRVEAESAWRDALERVDPDGTASAGSPWLVRNFHLPVAKAWADAGAWREARMVLAPVPERVCIRVRKFAALAAVEEKIEQGLRQERAAFETWLAAKSSQPWAHARTFWEQAKARVAGLVAPAALDTAEHAAQLVWSRPDLLVEVEFDERGQLHWFARDRQSETTDGTETPSPTAEEALWAWLQRMENV
jgi:tetratricopeptide (TPR) repeat protein